MVAAPRWRSFLFLLAVASALAFPVAAPAAAPRNIVFILLDDAGYGDLGAYGGTFAATPHLDRLAAEGQRFSNYRSSAPTCSPSRAAILTGAYPIRAGIPDALAAGSWRGLAAGLPTLADQLRSAGFATGHFGKWHLGELRPEYLPAAHGFDRSVIAVRREDGAGYVDPWLAVDGGPATRSPGHLTELTTQHAISFISQNRARRFFANVWYHAPHAPYEPPQRWRERYADTREGLYAATLSHVDEQIGRILFTLRLLGLDSRTLVIVSSDNGGVRKSVPSNGALSGFKGSLREGGLRVPFLARWAGGVPPGALNPGAFAGIDLAPTLLELAGVPPPAGLAGRSVAAAFGGARIEADGTTFWEIPQISPLSNPRGTGRYRYAVLRGRWKLVQEFEREATEAMLFDLDTDPGETTDLAPAHPDLAAELEREYRRWRLRESRLAVPIARVLGSASVRGAWLDLAGGEILLAPDSRLDFHDGAASFAVRVLPAALGTEQTLAEQEGGFLLALSETGTVRLRIAAEDGTTVALESAARLAPGVAADVAFTVFDWGTENSEVRLLVDARIEAESHEISALAPSSGRVRIGSDALGARPFRGRLFDPRFHLVSLDASELADSDLDGVPNADDVCIAVANVAQRDSDADGFGDACDPDIDGDDVVDSLDRLLVHRAYGKSEGDPLYDPRLDFDANGAVGFPDLVMIERALGAPPGPSGRTCTREHPCVAAAPPP